MASAVRAGRACEIASWYRSAVLHREQSPLSPWVACRAVGFRSGCLKWDRVRAAKKRLDAPCTRPRSALRGCPRVQTLVGRFVFRAGSVAASQTFDLGGQTFVLGGQTRAVPRTYGHAACTPCWLTRTNVWRDRTNIRTRGRLQKAQATSDPPSKKASDEPRLLGMRPRSAAARSHLGVL